MDSIKQKVLKEIMDMMDEKRVSKLKNKPTMESIMSKPSEGEAEHEIPSDDSEVSLADVLKAKKEEDEYC